MADGALYGDQLVQYLTDGSISRNLDPAAVLAIASVEGGFGAPPSNVGDGGTSFGPFQLHEGGALPSGVADPEVWANTPAGLDYALDAIASVAAGLTGLDAISAISSGFERPANVPGEIASAWANYPRFASGRAGGFTPSPQGGDSGITRPGGEPGTTPVGFESSLPGEKAFYSAWGSIFGGIWHTATGVTSDIASIGQSITAFVAFVTDPTNWLRLVELLAGMALLLLSLSMFTSIFSKGGPIALGQLVSKGGGGKLPVPPVE
jgi:hypothetical protein